MKVMEHKVNNFEVHNFGTFIYYNLVHLHLHFQNIFIISRENLLHIKQQVPILPFPFPNPWQPPIRFLVPMDLIILHISCKWKHKIHAFLHLDSFTEHNVFKVHPCTEKNHPSLHLIILHCMYVPLLFIH